jgi:hypothetical protein
VKPFRLTELVAPEDDVHFTIWCGLRRLLPADAVVNTWELRNAVSAAEGARRKRLGAQAGWPDMGVFWQRRVAFLEIKRARGGVLSPAQRDLHGRLQHNGFPVAVVRDLPQALDAISAAGIPVRGRVAI